MPGITCTKCGTVFPDRSAYATHQNAGCQGKPVESQALHHERDENGHQTGRIVDRAGALVGVLDDFVNYELALKEVEKASQAPPKDHLIPWQYLPSECNALGPGQYAGLRLMGRLTKEGFVVDDASLLRGRGW